MSTLNMLARKKTWIALLKIQARPKEIRTVKQRSKQAKQTNEAAITTKKKKKEKERQENIYKVITGSAVVDIFERIRESTLL